MEKIKVNLFSSSFNPPSCVFGKTPTYIEYVYQQPVWDGITLFVDECINDGSVDRVESKIKIGWLLEPHGLHPQTYQRAFFNMDKFDLIMTYYKPFLSLRNTAFCCYGGIWIPREKWQIPAKTRLCSMLYGDKMSTDGHKIRREIADSINGNGIYNQRIDMYHNPGYSWKTKYDMLAPYYFSIITETCREDNLFTEWLLDCFIMKTIPIFYGCPNLANIFDPNGVLSFSTYPEAIEKIEWLIYGHAGMNAEELYFSKVNAIQNNFIYAQQYEITEDWFYERVLKPKGYIDA